MARGIARAAAGWFSYRRITMAVCLANLVAALVMLRSLTSSAPAPKREAPALATPRRAHDSGTFDAYVVGKENAHGVVVLQEWWGVDYEVKNHAIHISQIDDGYKALIPHLYRGKVALEVAEAQHLMEGLDWPGAIKDIQASVKWLKENGSPMDKGVLILGLGMLLPHSSLLSTACHDVRRLDLHGQ